MLIYYTSFHDDPNSIHRHVYLGSNNCATIQLLCIVQNTILSSGENFQIHTDIVSNEHTDIIKKI